MSRGVFLRRAGERDTEALARLEAAASRNAWSAEQVRAELLRATPDAVLVLEGRDGIVGYCAYRLVVDDVHVMNLAVRPAARRRGFGRALLEAALVRAGRSGARRALLEVRAGNATARALYAECGFVLLGRRKEYYANPREDALVLVRDPLGGRGRSGRLGSILN